MDMKSKLMALKGKKKSMSENEMKAKSSVLKEMKSAAEGMMGDKLKGLKKVTVAAPDEEGLKKGLETAESLMGESEDQEQEDLSLDEIESQMAKLMMMKKKLMGHESEEETEEVEELT